VSRIILVIHWLWTLVLKDIYSFSNKAIYTKQEITSTSISETQKPMWIETISPTATPMKTNFLYKKLKENKLFSYFNKIKKIWK
jgi:hypothetical protein